MPNWCTTHYIAAGEESELRSLADTLNTMPNLKNGFGRFWMGNLLAAFGLDWEAIMRKSCRGTFDPDFGARSCLFGPSPDENGRFGVDPDGLMRFSATSAWARSEDIEEAITEKFPSIELSWSCTDEFGNFHQTHNPEGFEDLEKYETEEDTYGPDGFGRFLDDLRRCEGLEIPEDADEEYIRSDKFREAFDAWRDADEEREFVYFAVYEDK